MVFLFLVLGSWFLVHEHRTGGFRRAGSTKEWGQKNVGPDKLDRLILLSPFSCRWFGLLQFRFFRSSFVVYQGRLRGLRRAGSTKEWGQENGFLILLPPLRRFASPWAAFGCLSRFTRLFCLSLGLRQFDVGPLKVGLLGHGFANLGQRDLLDGQRVFLGVRDFGLVGGTSRRGGLRVLGGGLRELLLAQRV